MYGWEVVLYIQASGQEGEWGCNSAMPTLGLGSLVCMSTRACAGAGPAAESKRGEGRRALCAQRRPGCVSGAPESPCVAVSKSLNLAGPHSPHRKRGGSERPLSKVPFFPQWGSAISMTAGYF